MKTKRKFINVIPLSSKAKNRFNNIMENFHAMIVEQENDTQYFVTSLNKKYCFWLNKLMIQRYMKKRTYLKLSRKSIFNVFNLRSK